MPAQQSVGWLHDSLSAWHCERQVKVRGLQKPTQHSKSSMHAAAAAVHIAGRQRPDSQRPWQQSSELVQVAPGFPHAAFRHRLPTHCEPAQHSSVMAQGRPGALQLPLPAAQRPDTHCPLQHAALVLHSSPPGRQPHWPLRHWPSQQSVWNRQSEPAARQGKRQAPPTQLPSQHSASAPQG